MSAEAASTIPQSARPGKKPRFSIFLATACGLGYLPTAPGTWGSLGGLVLVTAATLYAAKIPLGGYRGDYDPLVPVAVFLATCVIGVLSAGRAARFWDAKDPQKVVIDEVSGQYLTLMLGCGLPYFASPRVLPLSPLRNFARHGALDWKYLLVGFILFRVFDIWKPFPARQVESLPGAWGIMADDWVAGIYAALGLWLARVAGL